MTKRGEPLPINQAHEQTQSQARSRTLDMDGHCLCLVTVFLVGFRMLAILSFPTMASRAWLIVRKHPKMFQLWGLSLNQKTYYDPRKD